MTSPSTVQRRWTQARESTGKTFLCFAMHGLPACICDRSTVWISLQMSVGTTPGHASSFSHCRTWYGLRQSHGGDNYLWKQVFPAKTYIYHFKRSDSGISKTNVYITLSQAFGTSYIKYETIRRKIRPGNSEWNTVHRPTLQVLSVWPHHMEQGPRVLHDIL